MKQLFTTALLLCALCAGALEYDLDVKTDKQHWALKAGEKEIGRASCRERV